jgi:hypothetical protein
VLLFDPPRRAPHHDEAGGELISIVGVEYKRVSNKTKVLLSNAANIGFFLGKEKNAANPVL